MWHSVNQQISNALHMPFEFTEKELLSASSAFRLYKLSNDSHQFLVKIDTFGLDQFESESHSRTLLIRDSDFLVADTILQGQSKKFSFMVLEYFNYDHLYEPHYWHKCGELLAKLHSKNEQGMFGSDEDNYILSIAQPNAWHKKWEVFFAEERLGIQLQMLAEKNILLTDIDKFVDTVKSQIPHHATPSLLHGYFCEENIQFVNGHPLLLEPACFYGDRHFDIATAELFSSLPVQFYEGYESILPINMCNKAKEIYQLYMLLVFANRFSGTFLEKAKLHIDKILTQ